VINTRTAETRALPTDTAANQDLTNWLDWFEALYEKLLHSDKPLARWMSSGWMIDRLVRPEMQTGFLNIYYHDPPPPPQKPRPRRKRRPRRKKFAIAPATEPNLFQSCLMRCTASGYRTQDPAIRNAGARLVCSLLNFENIAGELPQSSAEFEMFISNWVRLSTDDQLRAPQNSSTVPPAEEVTNEDDDNGEHIKD